MLIYLCLLTPRAPLSCSGTLSFINPLSTSDTNTSVESVLMDVILILCCRVFFISFISSDLFINGSSESNSFRSAAELIDILQPVLTILISSSVNTFTWKPVMFHRRNSPSLMVLNFGVVAWCVATIRSPGKIFVKHVRMAECMHLFRWLSQSILGNIFFTPGIDANNSMNPQRTLASVQK